MSEATFRPNTRENVIQVTENGIPLDEYLYVDAIRKNRVFIFYWYNITEENRYNEMTDTTTLFYVYGEITKFIDIPDTYTVNDEVITINKKSRDSIRAWVYTYIPEIVEILKSSGDYA